MIKLIITFNTPVFKQPRAIQDQLYSLFVKYKGLNKIVADFIYVTDAIIELRFDTLESAQMLEQEFKELNNNIAVFEYT